VPLEAHPGATLNCAADVGDAGAATIFHPRVSDFFDSLYLRHGVLLV
jgi:hypothetical protein